MVSVEVGLVFVIVPCELRIDIVASLNRRLAADGEGNDLACAKESSGKTFNTIICL